MKPPLHNPVISNRQNRIPLNSQFLRSFVKQLCSLLRLGQQRFDVTVVDDAEIARLNRTFRELPHPTDVLSFPWHNELKAEAEPSPARTEWAGFLGDLVISVETAQRHSIAAGVSIRMEMRQLVLHGVLHLLGYDHERDQGQMEKLEKSLRRTLGIEGHKGSGRRQPPAASIRRTSVRKVGGRKRTLDSRLSG